MSKSRPTQRRTQSTSASPRRSPARKKKQSPATMIAVLVVVLAIGVLVFNAYSRRIDPALAKVIEKYPSEGATHVPTGQRVQYKTEPPNSGPHYAQWAPPGFYDRQLPDELLVHNLEHGHIIIHYRPEALTEEIENYILSLTRAHTHNWAAVLAVPRPNMEHPFVLAAWRHLLRLEEFDRELVELFIDAFIGRGPENPIR